MTVGKVIKKLENLDKNLEVVILSQDLDFKVVDEVDKTEIRYIDMFGNLIEEPTTCVRLK